MFCVWLIGWRVSRFRCKRGATASATWSATPLDACRTSKAACRVCNRWWISSTTNPPSSAPVSPNSNSSSIRNRENPLQPPEVPIDFFFHILRFFSSSSKRKKNCCWEWWGSENAPRFQVLLAGLNGLRTMTNELRREMDYLQKNTTVLANLTRYITLAQLIILISIRWSDYKH